VVRRKTQLESAFQNKVIKYIEERGGYKIKIHASSYQTEGEPDIVCCYKGRFCAFELKQGSKLSDLQIIKLEMIRESGGIAMEVKDINQIKEVFDRIDEDANIRRV
jgi:penicillin-binding protein-related factor A (putative recombinase)